MSGFGKEEVEPGCGTVLSSRVDGCYRSLGMYVKANMLDSMFPL